MKTNQNQTFRVVDEEQKRRKSTWNGNGRGMKEEEERNEHSATLGTKSRRRWTT